MSKRFLFGGIVVAVISLVAAQAQSPAPTFELPPPTGPSPIGTTRWVVQDTSRTETFAPGKTREVEVVAWYPAAAANDPTAPYLRDGPEEVSSFARLAKLGNAFDSVAAVKTHAAVDAAPAASPARFPVILFQHGYTGLPSSHTGLAEDLASHGWVVLSIIHPYEATGARLAAGTVITFLNERGTLHQGILDVLNEWGPEDGTMTQITAATSDAEKEQLMRGYLAALKNTGLVVKRWVLDTRAVLDKLPRDDAAVRLASRLDLMKVGAAGTKHLDFTDMNYWGGPLRQRGAYGDIAPFRAAEITRAIVREFFGQEILGQPSPLLTGQAKWPDVTVAELHNR